MSQKSRISSIINTQQLSESITNFPTFDLAQLNIEETLDFELPTNLRLGHLAERVVSGLIKSSSNFNLLHENVQLIENKTTIGELDFIVKNLESGEIIHFELAYKFYLLDPSLSQNQINNWIGPNRRDSLIEKLEKLKSKQFPLLHHDCTQDTLSDLKVNNLSQSLCFLISLFVPHEFKENLTPEFAKAVKGYYADYATFQKMHNASKYYFLPHKKEWGIDPSENERWMTFEEINEELTFSIAEKQSPLIWQKEGSTFSELFVVWWG
jgi:uncharacterized protein